MGLNIKNEHVHQLAREAARRTGRTQTSAIEVALERYLSELDHADDRNALTSRGRVDRLLADVDARLTARGRATLVEADLYDDAGLPA